jgi:hypothetical protein
VTATITGHAHGIGGVKVGDEVAAVSWSNPSRCGTGEVVEVYAAVEVPSWWRFVVARDLVLPGCAGSRAINRIPAGGRNRGATRDGR